MLWKRGGLREGRGGSTLSGRRRSSSLRRGRFHSVLKVAGLCLRLPVRAL